MKRVILVIVFIISSTYIFSQTKNDIKNLTLEKILGNIRSDSNRYFIRSNIENINSFDYSSLKDYSELDNYYKSIDNLVLLHNSLLTIYLAKLINIEVFSKRIIELKDSLTIRDLNCLMKVSIYEARIGERDTIINGEKIVILEGLYTTEKESSLEILQQSVGEILMQRYEIKVDKPKSLTQVTTQQWYLSIIENALKQNPIYKDELVFLRKNIINY